ncbi:hypothetical protein BHAOGJBA_4438 [Methylobacterium hispanicum]|uniref:Uncharacterized protein n=1 Tax=Methylobacterium hispanicum TaxID=270350 RepID=A0AAV4ZRW6_9HYPH|nr:hypothetical protein [Methylobacterium hispanicum]GJD90894.1 hypothetical protein BHAOGJBA_4438 [Methylobacterium hispanicum]
MPVTHKFDEFALRPSRFRKARRVAERLSDALGVRVREQGPPEEAPYLDPDYSAPSGSKAA